jgi:hypothetical protein
LSMVFMDELLGVFRHALKAGSVCSLSLWERVGVRGYGL